MNRTTNLFVAAWLCAVFIPVNYGSLQAKDVPFPPRITIKDTGEKVNDFILAERGKKETVIIVGDRPEKYVFPFWGGAMNLKRYLTIITGTVLPTAPYSKFDRATSKYKYHIWIGRQPVVDGKFGELLDKLDHDGYLIACEGADLYIAGNNYRRGTHTAPFDLLERAAGCRWFFEPHSIWHPINPENLTGPGEIIPQADVVKIPGNTWIVEEPTYKNRFFRVAPVHAWRLNNRDKYHHALLRITPPKEYGKSHPEYFPLINGKRHIPPENRAYDFQPCVGNEEVTDLAVKIASKDFDNGVPCFSVGMNDSGKFCECEKCLAMIPDSALKKLTAATEDEKRLKQMKNAYIFFSWYNKVAERLYKDYPGKRLGCLAYATLSGLPEGMIRLHEMIIPYLTRDSAQLFDKNEQVEFRETVDKWSRLSHRMGIYEYIYGQGFYVPRLFNRYILKNIKEQYGVGCDGFYAEAYPQWRLDAPKYYFIAKLLWNKDYSISDLKKDYYTNCFGPAAKLMAKYFDFLEETWCEQTLESRRSNYRWMNDKKQLEIFPPETCDEALAFLDKSRKLLEKKAAKAKDDKEKKLLADNLMRVNYFRDGILFTRNLSYRYACNATLEKMMEEGKELSSTEMLQSYADFISTGNIRDIFNAKEKMRFDTTSRSTFHSFNYQWDRPKSVLTYNYQLVNSIFDKAYATRKETTKKGIQNAMDAVIAEMMATSGVESLPLWNKITKEAKERSFLFIPAIVEKDAPTIDGRIEEGEWGDPVLSGSLTAVYTVSEEFPYDTKVYAGLVGGEKKMLMLAFDCAGDPEVIGANVKPGDDDSKFPYKMAKDSAIAITMKPRAGQYRGWRFNVLGATAGFAGTSKVSRTENGWQLELSIPMKQSGISLKAIANTPSYLDFAIARYERVQREGAHKKKHTEVACGLPRPVHPYKGVIGHGNFDNYMSFVWGQRLVFGQAPDEAQEGND